MPIVIDQRKCKGCVLCLDACPHHLLKQAREMNDQGYQYAVYLDPEGKCTACTLCAVTCPDMCIEVFREEKRKEAGK